MIEFNFISPTVLNQQMSHRFAPFFMRCVALLMTPAALGCATAHLDPERNQALTFDTTPVDDAGVVAPPRSTAKKAAPSQPVNAIHQPEPLATSTPQAGVTAGPMTCTQEPPDPKPVNTRDWIAIDFEFTDGRVSAPSSHAVHTNKPRDSSRVVGRYAIELWIGCELIDRVRFNFPLQAAEAPPTTGKRHPLHEEPSLTAHARLRTTVLVPVSDRATRAELVDRGNGSRSSLAWPPKLSPTGANGELERKK